MKTLYNNILTYSATAAASVGGGADQSNQFAQLQRELEAVRHEAESVRVERDELKEQNDEVSSLSCTICSCISHM